MSQEATSKGSGSGVSSEELAGVKVSWSEETDTEPGRDFIGTIVSGEYPYKDENARFEGVQIRLMVRAEEPAYENLQPIWIPPSSGKGTKFVIWRSHLVQKCPKAWIEVAKKVQEAGKDPTSQLSAFASALVGMRFRFQDQHFPRANDPKQTVKLLVPLEYKGMGQVQEIKEEKVKL